MNKVTFDTQECGGCRTCEIACSYHHRKVFSPSISSTEVADRPQTLGFAVSFYIADTSGHLACDRCESEDEPLCLKYCSVLMHDELKAILQKVFSQKPSRGQKNEK